MIQLVFIVSLVLAGSVHISEILIAAAIGAWPPLSMALWRFVDIPMLRIRFDPDSDICKFQFPLISTGLGFLRLEVVNDGRTAAKNCEIKVRLPKSGRPSHDHKPCEAPSEEFETWMGVSWAGTNSHGLTTPPGGNAIANILVTPESRIPYNGEKWRGSSDWGNLMAWVSTFPVTYPENSFTDRIQDGVCVGDYQIDIGIFPHNGASFIKTYKLVVRSVWAQTLLERTSVH